MNGRSEHLNGRSQWVRVEFQVLTTNMRCGNRILTLPSKRVFDSFWLIAYQATAGARRCNLSANGFLTKSGHCTGGGLPRFSGHLVTAHTGPGGVSWYKGGGFQRRVNRQYDQTRAEARADLVDNIELWHHPRQRRRLAMQEPAKQLLTQPSAISG